MTVIHCMQKVMMAKFRLDMFSLQRKFMTPIDKLYNALTRMSTE